ncbi:MAG: hypothetical protein NTW08_09145 [Gammaproteobacteria bacterium]|nr:hypothetical protein [Gammaproteobacteria bacterium]
MSGEPVSLPSSKAILEDTEGFCAAALAYRDQRFLERSRAAGMEKECAPMAEELKKQTARAQTREARRGDHGVCKVEVQQSVHPDKEARIALLEEQMRAEVMVDGMIRRLIQDGLDSLRVDYALGPKAEMLAGVRGLTENGAVMDTSLIDAELGTPVFSAVLNECMFNQSGLVCESGVFYQAISRTELMKDKDGIPVRATVEQVEAGLAAMQEAYNQQDKSCEVNQRDYAATVQLINAAAVTQEQAEAPVAEEVASKATPKAEEGPRRS